MYSLKWFEKEEAFKDIEEEERIITVSLTLFSPYISIFIGSSEV